MNKARIEELVKKVLEAGSGHTYDPAEVLEPAIRAALETAVRETREECVEACIPFKEVVTR